MPLTHSWSLVRNPMAEHFNALIERMENENPSLDFCEGDLSDELLEREAEDPPKSCYEHYVYAAALFNFVKDGGYRNITYLLKYSRDIREGRFFAAMLGERVATAEWLSDVDTVVPVPLHWTRRLRRGYNQAEVIASEVAKALGARLRTDILKRRRRTSTQTKLGIEEKARNVSGAFAVSRKFRRRFHNPEILNSASSNGASGERNALNVRHILLVDDVFTTGSTLYNCWRPLHDFFGPQVRISIATLGVV